MDIEAVIVIGFIIVLGVKYGLKIKKLNEDWKEMQRNRPKVSVQPDEDFDFPHTEYEEDVMMQENEKFEADSSKSESYFTYETVLDQEVKESETASSMSSKSSGIQLQGVENETETGKYDLHNPEELKKAIIYGEILKNPYN